jgi:transcriptional regulator with XRE-family HTH domain
MRLEDVASRIGVDPSQVHRWERGKAIPKRDHAIAWETVLEGMERAS